MNCVVNPETCPTPTGMGDLILFGIALFFLALLVTSAWGKVKERRSAGEFPVPRWVVIGLALFVIYCVALVLWRLVNGQSVWP
jgi:hypothetical protein